MIDAPLSPTATARPTPSLRRWVPLLGAPLVLCVACAPRVDVVTTEDLIRSERTALRPISPDLTRADKLELKVDPGSFTGEELAFQVVRSPSCKRERVDVVKTRKQYKRTPMWGGVWEWVVGVGAAAACGGMLAAVRADDEPPEPGKEEEENEAATTAATVVVALLCTAPLALPITAYSRAVDYEQVSDPTRKKPVLETLHCRPRPLASYEVDLVFPDKQACNKALTTDPKGMVRLPIAASFSEDCLLGWGQVRVAGRAAGNIRLMSTVRGKRALAAYNAQREELTANPRAKEACDAGGLLASPFSEVRRFAQARCMRSLKDGASPDAAAQLYAGQKDKDRRAELLEVAAAPQRLLLVEALARRTLAARGEGLGLALEALRAVDAEQAGAVYGRLVEGVPPALLETVLYELLKRGVRTPDLIGPLRRARAGKGVPAPATELADRLLNTAMGIKCARELDQGCDAGTLMTHLRREPDAGAQRAMLDALPVGAHADVALVFAAEAVALAKAAARAKDDKKKDKDKNKKRGAGDGAKRPGLAGLVEHLEELDSKRVTFVDGFGGPRGESLVGHIASAETKDLSASDLRMLAWLLLDPAARKRARAALGSGDSAAVVSLLKGNNEKARKLRAFFTSTKASLAKVHRALEEETRAKAARARESFASGQAPRTGADGTDKKDRATKAVELHEAEMRAARKRLGMGPKEAARLGEQLLPRQTRFQVVRHMLLGAYREAFKALKHPAQEARLAGMLAETLLAEGTFMESKMLFRAIGDRAGLKRAVLAEGRAMLKSCKGGSYGACAHVAGVFLNAGNRRAVARYYHLAGSHALDASMTVLGLAGEFGSVENSMRNAEELRNKAHWYFERAKEVLRGR